MRSQGVGRDRGRVRSGKYMVLFDGKVIIRLLSMRRSEVQRHIEVVRPMKNPDIPHHHFTYEMTPQLLTMSDDEEEVFYECGVCEGRMAHHH